MSFTGNLMNLVASLDPNRGLAPQMADVLFGAAPSFSNVQAGSSTASAMTLFRQSPVARVSALSTITQVHPTSGQIHAWRHVGTPRLYSGDIAAMKRTARVLGLSVSRRGSAMRRGRRRPR